MIITDDHMALLEQLAFDWDDECEWGAVSTDPKRPFGNSNVKGDVSEILGREVGYDEARRLSIEMAGVVAMAIAFAVRRQGAVAVGVGVEVSLPWRAARLLREAS